jgi:hypothetical protein
MEIKIHLHLLFVFASFLTLIAQDFKARADAIICDIFTDQSFSLLNVKKQNHALPKIRP